MAIWPLLNLGLQSVGISWEEKWVLNLKAVSRIWITWVKSELLLKKAFIRDEPLDSIAATKTLLVDIFLLLQLKDKILSSASANEVEKLNWSNQMLIWISWIKQLSLLMHVSGIFLNTVVKSDITHSVSRNVDIKTVIFASLSDCPVIYQVLTWSNATRQWPLQIIWWCFWNCDYRRP